MEKFLEVCGGDGRRKMAAGAIEVFDLAAQIFLPNMNCVMGTLAGNRLRKCECFLQERERERYKETLVKMLWGERNKVRRKLATINGTISKAHNASRGL